MFTLENGISVDCTIVLLRVILALTVANWWRQISVVFFGCLLVRTLSFLAVIKDVDDLLDKLIKPEASSLDFGSVSVLAWLFKSWALPGFGVMVTHLLSPKIFSTLFIHWATLIWIIFSFYWFIIIEYSANVEFY